MLPRSRVLFWALGCIAIALNAHAFESSYWVWHRSAALRTDEIAELQRQGVAKLYWHVATVRAVEGQWRSAAQIELPPRAAGELALVPVVRIEPGADVPLSSAAADAFAAMLRGAAQRLGAAEVQIDYDCPERRRPEYASFLARCRAQLAPVRLSAAVLAGWSKSPALAQLQQSVDGLAPMFYDLFPDAPPEVRAGRVLPLIDSTAVTRQIESWRACKVPWAAGLPIFSRVTVFAADGRSRGHLREWEWDNICFDPALALRGTPAAGVTLFRAERPLVVAKTALARDNLAACRIPDLPALRAAIDVAQAAGAAGVVFFRLPGEGSQSGCSLPQMRTLITSRTAGEPVLRARRLPSGIELVNAGECDLAPRLAGPKGPLDRGWQLEIESRAGAVFREASPGEFASVFGHVEPDAAEPKRVPVALAQRLTFWFAHLPAGASRQTGLLQLAPGNDLPTLRWRIPDCGKFSQWQAIE